MEKEIAKIPFEYGTQEYCDYVANILERLKPEQQYDKLIPGTVHWIVCFLRGGAIEKAVDHLKFDYNKLVNYPKIKKTLEKYLTAPTKT